jgi:hypothetical protein
LFSSVFAFGSSKSGEDEPKHRLMAVNRECYPCTTFKTRPTQRVPEDEEPLVAMHHQAMKKLFPRT